MKYNKNNNHPFQFKMKLTLWSRNSSPLSFIICKLWKYQYKLPPIWHFLFIIVLSKIKLPVAISFHFTTQQLNNYVWRWHLYHIRVAHNLQKVRYEKCSHLLRVVGYIGWENEKNQFVSMHTYRSHAPPNL